MEHVFKQSPSSRYEAGDDVFSNPLYHEHIASEAHAYIIEALDRFAHADSLRDVVGEEGEWYLALIGMVLVVLILTLRYPKTSSVLVGLWAVWLGYALAQDGSEVFHNVYHRAIAAHASTHALFIALFNCAMAWLRLLAPFLSDVGGATATIWLAMTWQQRALLGFSILFLFGIVTTAKAVWHNIDRVTDILFQMAFLLVGPAAYFAMCYVEDGTALGVMLQLLTSAIPTGMSILALRSMIRHRDAQQRRGDPSSDASEDEGGHDAMAPEESNGGDGAEEREIKFVIGTCERWLGYWACWPALSLLFQCASYYAADMLDVQRMLIVLALWLQFWGGSRHVWYICSLISTIVIHRVPGIAYRMYHLLRLSTLTQSSSMWTLLRYASYIKLVWDHKLYFGIGAAIVAFFTVPTLLSMFSGVLTTLVMIGIALDTGRIVSKRIHALYESKLGSWVLVQALHLSMYMPIVGSLIGSFYPVLVGIVFTLGGTVIAVFV